MRLWFMSKVKQIIMKVAKAYFDCYSKAYGDNIYRYQHRF